jgi:hypothetical protein
MLRCPVVSRRFSLRRALGFGAAMALAASGLAVSAFAENNGVSLEAADGMEQLELDDFWYLDPRVESEHFLKFTRSPLARRMRTPTLRQALLSAHECDECDRIERYRIHLRN